LTLISTQNSSGPSNHSNHCNSTLTGSRGAQPRNFATKLWYLCPPPSHAICCSEFSLSLKLRLSAAARVRSQAKSCWICGDSGTEAGLLRVLRFPLLVLIPATAPQLSGPRGWCTRPSSGGQEVNACPLPRYQCSL
jgi:hypothetical protein